MMTAPQLVFTGMEDHEVGGTWYVRFRLAVCNREAFADALFEPAPDLPPGGSADDAARTWVEVRDGEDGDCLQCFRELSAASELGRLWFSTPRCDQPPRTVYIVLRDRRTRAWAASNLVSTALPKPLLVGRQPYDKEVGGVWHTYYPLGVVNRHLFPDDLFDVATDLPPSGRNTGASRTWVSIRDASTNSPLHGFTALSRADQLGDLWFSIPRCAPPPTQVRVVLHDRRCNQHFVSNTVSTRLPEPRLRLAGTERCSAAGEPLVRYRLSILNRHAYPDDLFGPSPAPATGGRDAAGSRTRVDVIDARTGEVIQRFHDLRSADGLGLLWFSVPEGHAPAERVYVRLDDRLCGARYTSNAVRTEGVQRPGIDVRD